MSAMDTDEKIRALEDELDYYLRNPTRHPDIKKEYKIFAGKEASRLLKTPQVVENYDLNAEWQYYWPVRIITIHLDKMRKLQVPPSVEAPRESPETEARIDTTIFGSTREFLSLRVEEIKTRVHEFVENVRDFFAACKFIFLILLFMALIKIKRMG